MQTSQVIIGRNKDQNLDANSLPPVDQEILSAGRVHPAQ